eukprot:2184244-Rhodomonas_salina.2
MAAVVRYAYAPTRVLGCVCSYARASTDIPHVPRSAPSVQAAGSLGVERRVAAQVPQCPPK